MRSAKAKHNIIAYARPFISTALIAGGLAQLAAPVLAQAVPAAGSDISNTATASYQDDSGTLVDTVSNTVTVKVAKVAGIVVKQVNFTNEVTPNVFKRGETIYANFKVTNTGNDGVKFNVPKQATVTGSVDSSLTKTQYKNGSGVWTDVTAAAGAQSQTIAPDEFLEVRVELKISSTAIDNSYIKVKLGNTNSTGAINRPRGLDGELINDSEDIYTVDVTTAALASGGNAVVKLGGVAANGIREASDEQQVQVNADKLAVPSITLTHGAPVPIGTTNADTVPFNVSVNVAPTDVNGSPNADLAPTTIKLGTGAAPTAGTDTPRVIVAVPIPTGSTYDSVTAPTDWTVVYTSTEYSTTTPGGGTGAVGTAIWSTTVPTAGVKQVAFIYTPTGAPATGAPLPASATPYTGFTVNVTTTSLGTVNAIASVYGTTPKADGTPDDTKPAKADGNDTVTTTRTAVASPIYNGTAASAQAKGPGGDQNTDFTNKSMVISSANAVRNPSTGILNKTITTSNVTFQNTVENTNSGTTDVYLLPTPPATAGDLPTDTEVTIKNSSGTESRTYKYDGSAFTYLSTTTTSTTPIKLSILADQTDGYQVVVKLPTNIDQLKGYPVPITAFTGGTITNLMAVLPVTSASGVTPATFAPTAKNVTIDRVYTGFIDIIKEVRSLNATTQKDDPSTGALTYSNGVTTAVTATPGKFIQYRIRAVNISTAEDATAVDSKFLDAKNLTIVDKGDGTNGWATTTSHVPSAAKAMLGSNALTNVIEFNQGAKSDSQTDVTRYDVNFGNTNLITPAKPGSFVFIRKVNEPATVAPAAPAAAL